MTAILSGHPSHAKVYPLAGPRKYPYFSVILRPWVLVWPRQSNLRLPALLLNALPTEITLPLNSGLQTRCKKTDLPLGSLLSFNRELKRATTTATESTSHQITLNLSNVRDFFSSWVLRVCISVKKKRKESSCLVLHSQWNVKLRSFTSLSYPWRQRNVQKYVMLVQSCCLLIRLRHTYPFLVENGYFFSG